MGRVEMHLLWRQIGPASYSQLKLEAVGIDPLQACLSPQLGVGSSACGGRDSRDLPFSFEGWGSELLKVTQSQGNPRRGWGFPTPSQALLLTHTVVPTICN
jgi:hypothetical protein